MQTDRFCHERQGSLAPTPPSAPVASLDWYRTYVPNVNTTPINVTLLMNGE